MIEARVTREEGLRFAGRTSRAAIAVNPEEAGGAGPKELVALGLAGCTAMDVESILEKMRAVPDRLEVTVRGETEETHPKAFRSFTVVFQIDGAVGEDQARRAVELSMTRYCGVAATLVARAPIAAEILLNGKPVEDRMEAAFEMDAAGRDGR